MMATGQGNGQGGREVGQKANQLPGYRHIDVPEERQYVADVWGIPVDELPWEGAAAPEMIHLMADGEIKSCLIVCSNLMVSLPDNKVVKQALERLDPLIVIDFFLSETAELADVILPGSVWCEDEGTTTNMEGRVIKINRAADPPGESWADLPPAEEPGNAYPFRLTTGRVVYHYLTGNQTRRLGYLNEQAPEPWVEIHSQAASRLGIVNDEIVRVRTPRFSMELKALVVPTIRPDTLFIPYHYGHEQAVNQLTNSAVEPNAKIPEYKVCAATVEKLTAPAVSPSADGVIENFTPENAPRMFPYVVGETKDQPTKDAKTY